MAPKTFLHNDTYLYIFWVCISLPLKYYKFIKFTGWIEECVFAPLIAVAKGIIQSDILAASVRYAPRPCQVSVLSTLPQHPGKEISVITSKFHEGEGGCTAWNQDGQGQSTEEGFLPDSY